MQARTIRLSLLIVCLGLTALGGAQNKTPTVLERVQNVDDPELGELIRIALENQTEGDRLGQKATLELIRKVTLSYTQIKLFDQQIAEVDRKLEATTGPPEMRYELLLARTELEARLAEKLAELREVMGVVPRHPFDEKPIEDLSAWVHLVVLDQGVHVLRNLKPFSDFWANCRWESVGVLPADATLDFAREQLTDASRLPIRFDLYYRPSTRGLAEDLGRKIMALAMETNSQMESEVHVEARTWVGSGEAPFFVRDGQIRTFYPTPVRRPDKFNNETLATGPVELDDLDQHILWRLTMPKNVPVTFRIEYDRAGFGQAQRIAEEVRRLAKRAKVEALVDVNAVLVDPIPEAIFLGSWRAVTPGEIKEVEIRPEGKTELLMRKWSERQAPMTKVAAPWTLATKDIFIETGRWMMYRGILDGEGHLVLDRGTIYPHGSWHDEGGSPIVFEKID